MKRQQFTATGDGKTNISRSPAPNIQDLPQPTGNIENAMLYMYSCHSADTNPHPHGEGDHQQGALLGSQRPIAYVFAQYFKFYGVQGTSESVNYHYGLMDLFSLHQIICNHIQQMEVNGAFTTIPITH